jgi:hypothetical protein
MQDKQLYVSDAKALHHILVKDQYVFEEAKWFIQYVFCRLLYISPRPGTVYRSNRLMFGMGLFGTLGGLSP